MHSEALQSLARICTRPLPTTADVLDACALVRDALRAEDAYVIRAGDPYFIRMGCECEPSTYEIKQRGYWIIWREGAANPTVPAGLFDVDGGIVAGGRPLAAGVPATHAGAILPGDESNSEILVVRGPWPSGLTREHVQFIEAARPITAHLVSNVLDAQRRVRQRDQLTSLADVSNAFNSAGAIDDALANIATALAKSANVDWVSIMTYNDAGDGISERITNRARHSETDTAAQFQGTTNRAASPVELRLGHELAKSGGAILISDMFEPDIMERAELELLRPELPALRAYFRRAHLISVAVFPLVFQDRALGFVSFTTSTSHSFGEAEVAFLRALVSQAATAIMGIRLYRELQESQAEVSRREEWFRSLVLNTSDLITVIDADTTVRYQSPSIERVLGHRADDLAGHKLIDHVHPDDAAGFIAALRDLMTDREGVVTGEGRVRHRDGQWRHLEFTGTDQHTNPAINGLVLNLRDVTERKLLEQQLRYQATHDPLTALANRSRLADRLQHALIRSERTGTRVAVLFMDLDNFKSVNDSLGHSAGDRLLTQVAERVQGCLRAVDTVARLGGDEFVILLEDVTAEGEATEVTGRIFDALGPPFELDGKEIIVRASVGIAVSDAQRHRTDGDALLRDADTAMYVAKAHGKGRFEVFEPSMQVALLDRLELLADLQHAVDAGEFVLQYQPMISLASGQLFGVEALVRWHHPRRGIIAPSSFISLAEDSGTIIPLGRWVLEEACQQAAAWERAYPAATAWTMSVNVSARQLQHPGFADEVAHALEQSGLRPQRLILEITESVMMQDVTMMMGRLHELKALGVRLAIDDFGTGYSSLSYLRQFPFDLLKIDKSFIDDVASVPQQKELTRAIIELGKTLDLEMVAEGIESNEQLVRLQTLDCDLGQGFYFARPLDHQSIAELLAGAEPKHDAA